MNRFSISHCDQIYDNSVLSGLPQTSNTTTKDSLEINSTLKRYNKIQWHNKMSTTDSWPIHYSSTIFLCQTRQESQPTVQLLHRNKYSQISIPFRCNQTHKRLSPGSPYTLTGQLMCHPVQVAKSSEGPNGV